MFRPAGLDQDSGCWLFVAFLPSRWCPSLMVMFIRGRLRPESSNPVSRVTQALYLPVLRLCLRFPKTTRAS